MIDLHRPEVLHFDNRKFFLISLIAYGNCNAIIKFIDIFPELYSYALNSAVKSEINNLTLISALIRHMPARLQRSFEKTILDALSWAENKETAALLLQTLGNKVQNNTDIWLEVALTAVKYNDLKLLNQFPASTLALCLKTIKNDTNLNSLQQEQMRLRIERVFFHQLNSQYPLYPVRPSLWQRITHCIHPTDNGPTISTILAKLSKDERSKHLPILILLGHVKKPVAPPLRLKVQDSESKQTTQLKVKEELELKPLIKKPPPPSKPRQTRIFSSHQPQHKQKDTVENSKIPYISIETSL